MHCGYFDAGRCRSCTLMGTPHETQVEGKQAVAVRLLDPFGPVQWLPAYAPVDTAFRNRAKMVVGGTHKKLTLGILDAEGHGVDLRGCGVLDPAIVSSLGVIAAFLRHTGLPPYDVPARRGELKHVLVTANPRGELMVRFVVRSVEAVHVLREHLSGLLERLPQAKVVTANLLPRHVAALEGAEEIHLAGESTLAMPLGPLELHLRPQGFFQTNTAVAQEMYAQAARWAAQLAPRSAWDLYCGVGGFALHLAEHVHDVLGVEISQEAVRAARRSADEAGLSARFEAADATAFALAADSREHPELVLVNPPRRGLGRELAAWLDGSQAKQVIYSSCNAESLAKDLASMPSWRVAEARVLDMFPQTAHFEVITRLERADAR